jgi:hypothetical protein
MLRNLRGDKSLSASPTRAKLYGFDAAVSYTRTVSSVGGFDGVVSLIATGYPTAIPALLEPSLVYVSPSKDGTFLRSSKNGHGSPANITGALN